MENDKEDATDDTRKDIKYALGSMYFLTSITFLANNNAHHLNKHCFLFDCLSFKEEERYWLYVNERSSIIKIKEFKFSYSFWAFILEISKRMVIIRIPVEGAIN